MNNDEMFTAINKGIPNQIKLELSFNDLINYCYIDKKELLASLLNIIKEYERTITKICGYNKSHHEFFDNLRLITNYKNSNTGIYVSPICFIKKIKEILGVHNSVTDINDEELVKDLNERLHVLNSIHDIDELKDEFPLIFEDYKYSLNLMDNIREEEKNNSDKADFMRIEYQKNGLDTRFNVFLSNQKLMYKSFIDHAKDIIEYADTNPISFDKFTGLDKDKFELFIAYKYLEYAKEEENKQAAIYYLTTYLNELGGRNSSMIYKDKEISSVYILKELRKILKNNKTLKAVNEPRNVFNSYHVKHVKNHLNKYLNSLDNWCVLRLTPNEILQNQQSRIEKLADYHMNESNTKSNNIKFLKVQKYITMFIRKLNFYENSNYELRLFGIGPFESHVAYLYPNGMVVVDKFYDESLDVNPTYNEAIYVMDINTFLNMISMDKPNLRGNENVKRIFHSGHWEDRLQEEINNPTINIDSQDIKKLTKIYGLNKNNK